MLLCCSPLWAETVTIPALGDNTLYEDTQGSLSNGQGQGMFAGITGGQTGFERRRALVSFDVAGNVPAGADILEAQLRLTMTRTISGQHTVSLHRVLASWGEGTSVAPGEGGGGGSSTSGDATWTHRFFNTESWTTPGGDFSSTPSAATSVSGLGLYTWASTAELVADVQLWLDTPASNAGWILIGDESGGNSAKRFATREHSTVANRPQLVVTFMPTAVAGESWGVIKSFYR